MATCMATSPYSSSELVAALAGIHRRVADVVRAASTGHFSAGTAEAWSAADYLKHLLISVKPVAKALNMPPEKLAAMFGQPEKPSRPYAEIVALYDARIAAGLRAEDSSVVIPAAYRFPEGVAIGDPDSEKTHLMQAWDDANSKLLSAIEHIEETVLDNHQLPHPAIGMLTLREMLFFTLHHNTRHAHDIEQAIAMATPGAAASPYG